MIDASNCRLPAIPRGEVTDHRQTAGFRGRGGVEDAADRAGGWIMQSEHRDFRQRDVDSFVRDVMVPLHQQRDRELHNELGESSAFPFEQVMTFAEVRRIVDLELAAQRAPEAPSLGDFKLAVDRVAEEISERIGVDAAELEPQRCRLQHVALHRWKAGCAHEVGIARAIDEHLSLVGDTAGLVLHDDVSNAVSVHQAVRKPGVIEQRHPAFEQQPLGGELEDLVVDGEITAFQRRIRTAELGRVLQKLKGYSPDVLLAEMAELADRRHQRACRHAADKAIALDQQRLCAVARRGNGRDEPGRTAAANDHVVAARHRHIPGRLTDRHSFPGYRRHVCFPMI